MAASREQFQHQHVFVKRAGWEGWDEIGSLQRRSELVSYEILKEQGCTPGYFFVKGMKNADQKRAKKANHRATPKVKKRRKVLG